MKILFYYILTALLLISCSNNDDNAGSKYIPNVTFDTGNAINTNLPQYSNLQYNGNFITNYNYGVNGISIYRLGDLYVAFELSDPNHVLSGCSKLTEDDNGIFTCNCEEQNQYNIITGQPWAGTNASQALKPYRVSVNGSIIRVYND